MERGVGEFERIRSVLVDVGVDEALTAREISELLDAAGVEVGSAHRVATVLGRRAATDEVEVLRSQPYRYRVSQ